MFPLSILEIWTDMKMVRYFVAVLLLFPAIQLVSGQARSLTVQINAAETTVKNNERFSVSTTIRNSGTKEEKVLVWACTFPSEWVVDNPSIYVHQPNCLQNPRTWIRLKRGDVYRRVVSLYAHLPALSVYSKEVTFRMGFGNRLLSENQKHNSKAHVIWSNPITLIVTR